MLLLTQLTYTRPFISSGGALDVRNDKTLGTSSIHFRFSNHPSQSFTCVSVLYGDATHPSDDQQQGHSLTSIRHAASDTTDIHSTVHLQWGALDVRNDKTLGTSSIHFRFSNHPSQSFTCVSVLYGDATHPSDDQQQGHSLNSIRHAASDTTDIHSTVHLQWGSSGCQIWQNSRNVIHPFQILAIAAIDIWHLILSQAP